MSERNRTEEQKHKAGGPGKASKEGHIDPEKSNKPGQLQTEHPRGPGGGGGGRGASDEQKKRPG